MKKHKFTSKKDVTIISIPNANQKQLANFKEALENAMITQEPVITSGEVKLYRIKNGKTYEIIEKEI